MNQPLVFVTGMFRSGTTLLARLLHSHPEVAFASDPFSELFKEFRNTVAEELCPGSPVDRAAPLDDYYFHAEKQALMRRIQAVELNHHLGTLPPDDLRKKIAVRSKPFSPLLEPHLALLTGSTFAEWFAGGFEAIRLAYGSASTQQIGFKETWGGEFVPHVLRCWPAAKAVYLIRDPRAVAASKNVTEEKYPWLFLARQWRKLATFGWIHSRNSPYQDRVRLVRFEDLIQYPEREIRALCDFLEVDFHENLVDPSRFVDGAGKPWKQNSSHFKESRSFNPKSLEKWREVLQPREIEFIEALCALEMSCFGYSTNQSEKSELAPSLVLDPPSVAQTELAEWIRPNAKLGSEVAELGLEFMRDRLLRSTEPMSEEIKTQLCLDERFFDTLRGRPK